MTITARYAARRLMAIRTLIDNLIIDVPRAINANRGEYHHLDGYTTPTSGPAVHTSRGTTSVEQAIIGAAALDEELDDIDATLGALAANINDLLHLIRKRAPRLTETELKELRCSGGAGLPGAIEWGRPDCDNIKASNRNGMCDACAMRQYRWTKRQSERAMA